MSRRITWLGVVMVACFLVLFIQLNNIQVVKARQYANAPGNPSILAAKNTQPRGAILSADNVVLADSVPAPKGNLYGYSYQRQYPTGSLFSDVVGLYSEVYGNYGVEDSYNSYLIAHNRPIKTLGDLLATRTVTDNVTLTLSNALQTDARNALGGQDGSIVVMNPTTGAIEAMYSNPSYDPNPIVSLDCAVWSGAGSNRKCTQTVAAQGWTAANAPDGLGFVPLSALAYQNPQAPGSTFKVVTSSAAYQHAPQLVNTPMPSYDCIPPGTLGGQTTKPLCNFDVTSSCGGTIAEMLPPSCDTGFALLGTQIQAPGMIAEADSFGFNQQPPIDLPHDPALETSPFLQSSCYQNKPSDQIILAYASIGQECTEATPLQMAMVASGIANGGVVMTPHVMSQVRDSQGNLVATYNPTPWLTAASPATASAISGLMNQVVTSGTASGVGFPPNLDVSAKTGTAQIQNVQGVTTSLNDWMIAFAPASAPKVAVAVLMPKQGVSTQGATVAGPIVNAMIQAALGS